MNSNFDINFLEKIASFGEVKILTLANMFEQLDAEDDRSKMQEKMIEYAKIQIELETKIVEILTALDSENSVKKY